MIQKKLKGTLTIPTFLDGAMIAERLQCKY